jgi:hypothetical protein
LRQIPHGLDRAAFCGDAIDQAQAAAVFHSQVASCGGYMVPAAHVLARETLAFSFACKLDVLDPRVEDILVAQANQ